LASNLNTPGIMKNSKRMWTKEELTIAYYIAKWDYNGLRATENDLVDIAIGNTTKASLNMHVANFRHLLNIDGYKLENTSKLMDVIIEELKNKTITQVRSIVNKILAGKEDKFAAAQTNRNNAKIAEGAEKANILLTLIFEKKLKSMNRYRNLIPKI